MANRPVIFPTFFLSGFECSTFLWKDGKRRNLAAESRHDRHAMEDYRILRGLGIGTAREGVPWPLVDRDGRYDFTLIDPFIEAMAATGIAPIWDLCHFGYPDGLDPFSTAFASRFANYCRAVAEYVVPKLPDPCFFTPINEISFFSVSGGEWGAIAPFSTGRDGRIRLRLALCRAAIAGVNAIREIDPGARMVHVDPLVHVVTPRDRPDLTDAAYHEAHEDAFMAWDILAGNFHPELGGSPDILDIVGADIYSFSQTEYREHGPYAPLPADDDRIRPIRDQLVETWERYKRPMIIGETSSAKSGRPAWLGHIMQESLAALEQGVGLHGICLYPGVDMRDWDTGEWVRNGFYDIVEENGDLKRVPAAAYVDELRRWQNILADKTLPGTNPS